MHAFVRGKGFSLVHEFHNAGGNFVGVYKAAGEDHSVYAAMEESTVAANSLQ